MNSYRVTMKYYDGTHKTLYLPAQNNGEAFAKAHRFITQYDGCREIVPEKVSKKYMAEHGLEYSNEDELRKEAERRNYHGLKAAQMDEAIKRVLEITKITRPECDTRIVYLRVTDENIDWCNDWDRRRFGIHVGDERILVGKRGEGILYALNVSGDSVMQSVAELTDLLAGKGW